MVHSGARLLALKSISLCTAKDRCTPGIARVLFGHSGAP